MGRNLTGWALLLSIGLCIAAPADAKDRKSAAAGDREPLADVAAPREARSVSMRQETFAASSARSAVSSSSAEVSSSGRNGKPYATLAEQPELRSNPLRVTIGAVAVQPSIGGINGARFSIGF